LAMIGQVNQIQGKGSVNVKSKNPLDDKYINIDVFLRICLMEYVKVKLNQVD
jgi:hypothetical protein